MNIIVEVTHLEAILSIQLHLVRVSLSKARYHLSVSGEMVDWIWVGRVTYTTYSSNQADEYEGHLDPPPPNPSVEGVTTSLVEVYVELPHYLLYHWAVILNHIYLALGIQHCPYFRGTLVKLFYDSPSLHDNPAPVIVAEVTTLDLVPLKTGAVIYQLFVLLICGSTSPSNQLTKD